MLSALRQPHCITRSKKFGASPKSWAKQATGDRPKYLAMGAELETFSALAERRKVWLSNVEHEEVRFAQSGFFQRKLQCRRPTACCHENVFAE